MAAPSPNPAPIPEAAPTSMLTPMLNPAHVHPPRPPAADHAELIFTCGRWLCGSPVWYGLITQPNKARDDTALNPERVAAMLAHFPKEMKVASDAKAAEEWINAHGSTYGGFAKLYDFGSSAAVHEDFTKVVNAQQMADLMAASKHEHGK